MSLHGSWLFSLVPISTEASRILYQNPKYAVRFNGIESLSFRTSHRSRIPGHLVSFGSNVDASDVLLDKHSPSRQCSFYIVPSGELILEDATAKPQRATIMSWQRAGRAKHTNAIKMAGNGQRHVLPLADADSIVVDFGSHALFYFRWRQPLTPSAVAALRQSLAAVGWKSFVASLDKDMASGDYETLRKLAHKPRCAKAAEMPRERAGRGVVGRLHSYGELGIGSTSITSAAVDVESGRLWAVKKVIDREGRPDWKRGFKREVEQLQKLKHPSILRLEHSRGWRQGGPVELFSQLCEGNVSELFPRPHSCKHKYQTSEPWLVSFVDQVLSGLDYIHRRGLVHGNLSPSNILYSYRPGHWEPHFYVSAVGLQTLQAPLTSLSGTTMYVAPETSRRGQFGSAADVYSFAMVLLEVLGKYCPREASPSLFSEADWREKLRQYGAIHYHAYRDVIPAKAYVPGLQVSHSRVQSLVDCTLLHSALQHALHQEPSCRSTASLARAEIGDFVRMRCRGHRQKQVVVQRIAWH